MTSSNPIKQVPQCRLRAAVLGCTGAVGQRFIALLANHPWFEIGVLCASPRSAGKPYREAVSWRMASPLPDAVKDIVVRTCEGTLEPDHPVLGCDVAFSGLDAAVAGDVEAAVATGGVPVFSNAKNWRMHSLVPLVVPTANADHLAPLIAAQKKALSSQSGENDGKRLRLENGKAKDSSAAAHPFGAPQSWTRGAGGFIVTNANCSTTGLTVVLRALQEKFGPLDAVQVNTLQAISGAGYPGLPSLDVLDNVVPYISGEEGKLETEPLKILGRVEPPSSSSSADASQLEDLPKVVPASFTVSASCNRVAVIDGHTLNVAVRFHPSVTPKPSVEQIEEALAAYVPEPRDHLKSCPSYPKQDGAIRVMREADRPQPRLDRECGSGMTVSVGRVRECPLFDIKFVVLAHNTILGAAGSSILNAEIAVNQGLFGQTSS